MKNILVLSPHTDDGELGCGATISKLIDQGHDVRCIALTNCGKPELSGEFLNASKKFNGLKTSLFDFEVRNFARDRQRILDLFIKIQSEELYDIVFIPSANDLHQDHRVVYEEGLRAFKKCTLYGYELPWNNIIFNLQAFFKVEERHIKQKIAAINEYKSQAHRNYMSEKFIYSLAQVRGTQIGAEFAECFEIIRWID